MCTHIYIYIQYMLYIYMYILFIYICGSYVDCERYRQSQWTFCLIEFLGYQAGFAALLWSCLYVQYIYINTHHDHDRKMLHWQIILSILGSATFGTQGKWVSEMGVSCQSNWLIFAMGHLLASTSYAVYMNPELFRYFEELFLTWNILSAQWIS